MANENEPRNWEDYTYGSSDQPKIGGGYKPGTKPGTLERNISNLSTKFYKNSEIDVERTNKYRISFALSIRMLPVTRIKGIIKYRKILQDKDSLIDIVYTSEMPNHLEAISDEEKLPIDIAATYVGISKKDIKNLIRNGELEGTSSSVNLNSLNKYKSGLDNIKG